MWRIGLLRIITLGGLIILMSQAGPPAVCKEEEKLRLTLEMPERTFRSNESIVCRVELENIGTSSARILNSFILENLFVRLDIWDEEGHRIPFVGDQLRIAIDPGWVVELRTRNWVGQSIQVYDRAARDPAQHGQYDLSREGRYKASAVYSILEGCVGEKMWHGEVRSNEIQFEVLP